MLGGNPGGSLFGTSGTTGGAGLFNSMNQSQKPGGAGLFGNSTMGQASSG